MWGAEITMAGLYKSSHRWSTTRSSPACRTTWWAPIKPRTGAVYVIDKMPNPSAQYKDQTDVLAGTTPPAPTQFLRGPDTQALGTALA